MPERRALSLAIVGAPKAGTTSLAEALDTHPNIHLSRPKDGHAFLPIPKGGWQGPNGSEFHSKQILAQDKWNGGAIADHEQLLVDASVFHSDSLDALQAIEQTLTSQGFVVYCMRHPGRRAFSAYQHMVRDGHERLTFADALAAEEDRIRNDWQPIWSLAGGSNYVTHVRKLVDVFGHSRLLFIKYDDLIRDPIVALERIGERMGVDPSGFKPLPHVNASGVPRSSLLQTFLNQRNAIKTTASKLVPRSLWLRLRHKIEVANLAPSPYNELEAATIMDDFETHIVELENATGLELKSWLE